MAISDPTALVIEDDPSLLESVSTALGPRFRVVTATTGHQARDILTQAPVDLALVDYVLPDTSGLLLLRELQRAVPGLPIILMTGFGSEDLVVDSFRSGIRDYLRKPFTLRDLLTCVDRALRPRHADTGPAAESVKPSLSNGALARALRFVDLHLCDHLPLDRVAQEAGMSKFHFCRVFRQQVGVPFHQFLARRRIGRAAELLQEGTRSVSDVSVDVGFHTDSHFGRVFRQLVGRPPSAHQRSFRRATWPPGPTRAA